MICTIGTSRADETPAGHGRGRAIALGSTYAAGVLALAATLRIRPGDPWFYPATVGLAAIWLVGALASARAGRPIPRLGRAPGGRRSLGVTGAGMALALGLLLVGGFLAGAALLAGQPALADPLDALLGHARVGPLAPVLAITMLNGIAEELYFRGALFAALPARRAVAVSTVLYTATTIGAGVPLLIVAAAVIGLVTAMQRRATGGVLAPIITHVTWSSGMLLLLPPVLEMTR